MGTVQSDDSFMVSMVLTHKILAAVARADCGQISLKGSFGTYWNIIWRNTSPCQPQPGCRTCPPLGWNQSLESLPVGKCTIWPRLKVGWAQFKIWKILYFIYMWKKSRSIKYSRFHPQAPLRRVCHHHESCSMYGCCSCWWHGPGWSICESQV